ncbi:hypothetical protein M422DRAFT_28396 [Sphaerobolus stellatus SS14]|nr:hypothetical protein M422DRAFT_28396 [Sphaerobolus stellatus SS14]
MLFTISHYAPNLERIGPSIPDRAPCLIAYEDAISALTKFQYLTHIGLDLYFKKPSVLDSKILMDLSVTKTLKYIREPWPSINYASENYREENIGWTEILRGHTGEVIGSKLLQGKDIRGVQVRDWGNFFRDIHS